MPNIGPKMFYVHAQMSEHAQYVLLFYAHAYWLSMPTDVCAVHMPIVIINSKLRVVEQNSVPYMLKVILTHIPVQCGVLTLMYIDSLRFPKYGIQTHFKGNRTIKNILVKP